MEWILGNSYSRFADGSEISNESLRRNPDTSCKWSEKPPSKKARSHGPIPDSIMLGVIVDGTISSAVDFGAFVRVSPDFDALLHHSESGQLMESEGRPLEIGEGVRVEVINVDHDRSQVGLRLIGRNNLGASEI